MVEKMSELGQTSRASTALLKRQEAIKRWKSSDTNREAPHRPSNKVSVTFEKETILLSAVSSGDLDETKKLINDGVDINCANVDGLTGLHQACIDENEEMVELLVECGAFLDACDDEGWTPLHAAASAGNISIAQILVDKGADLLAVNNEGEIPADLAEEEEMDEYLEEEMEKLGVEVDEIRSQEEKLMLEDATSWVNSNKLDEQYNFQGASALHVAAAKGYHKVMKLLLQAGSDVNCKDSDGWTPLHAAVHWGQQQAAEILTEAGGDFNIRNNIGQTPNDLAEGDMMKSVEELRKRAKDLAKDGLLKKANQRIIDDKGQGLTKQKNDINDNDSSRLNKDARTLQDRSNQIPDSNAKPVKSALKGGREKHRTQNNDTTNNKESAASESESGTESESDSESENRPTTTPLLSGPIRPSALTRPSTTATNEKVSTQRNPLIGVAPTRPSSLINRDNDKRDENKEDSITARLNSRIKQREDDNKKESDRGGREPIRFNIPRPGSKNEDNDGVVSFNIPRPSSRSDDNKKDDAKSKFNIPRPSSLRNDEKKDEQKSDERSRNLPLRPTRSDDREEDTKRHSSKAEEIRAKFNIPRPGDSSAASSALSRFRERKNEEAEDSTKPDENSRKLVATRIEEAPSSLRARKNPFAAPLRPTRSSESRADKPDNETSLFSRRRDDQDKVEDREETISIRKRLADRKEAEKDKENEAEKKDDDEESASLSAQRARRSRRPREKRKATGVAYMPDEDEDDEEEKKDTKFNTKANEENEGRRSNVALDQDEPPRMSLAERLRKSRENREGLSSVSSLSSSRNRDIGSSLTSSKSSGDGLENRELQRKLRDALNDVEDYKAKLDKVTKEKEELQEKLAQCEEAMKKMKDENGALIRVISTLTRSNSS